MSRSNISTSNLRVAHCIARAEFARVGGAVASDLLEDCLLTAELTVWRLDRQVTALSPAERPQFVAVCVGRDVRRFLRRERHAAALLMPLDGVMEGLASETIDALSGGCSANGDASESLAAALSVLTSAERRIVDLAYAQELSDREVAVRLGLTPCAAKKRRQRMLARLRRAIEAALIG